MIRDETEATAPPIVSSSGLRAGVSLMPDNLVAFAWRVLSARAATRTLDLQYYRWAEDVTGRLLANEVLRAADRGVRVRLLLDDLYIRESELALATLSQHPSIDIRLFNPFQLRSWGAVGSAIEFLLAGYRLNHRMHNKAWIGDGELFIGGGRNIGDAYFDASSQFNFRDLDLVVMGPLCPKPSPSSSAIGLIAGCGRSNGSLCRDCGQTDWRRCAERLQHPRSPPHPQPTWSASARCQS